MWAPTIPRHLHKSFMRFLLLLQVLLSTIELEADMGNSTHPSPTFEKRLTLGRKHQAPARLEESEHQLDVSVVFTSAEATSAALRHAGALADRLNARIRLVAPQVVPYHLPLESPPVLLDFSEHRLLEIARESPVETTIQIYLCRDAWEALKNVLAPHSLVVIGGKRRWWRTREESLARRLHRAGHEVVFTEME